MRHWLSWSKCGGVLTKWTSVAPLWRVPTSFRKARRQFGVASLGPEIQVDHTYWVAFTHVHLADNRRLKARKVDDWGAHDEGFFRIELQVHSSGEASGSPLQISISTIELVPLSFVYK
jgi:hypothetical protein